MTAQEMKQWNNDLQAGKLKKITVDEMVQRITTNEQAMRRINKCIAGTRKMEGSYLEITQSIVLELLTWEEIQIIDKDSIVDDFLESAINTMI